MALRLFADNLNVDFRNHTIFTPQIFASIGIAYRHILEHTLLE
jgi:hypothetical protein